MEEQPAQKQTAAPMQAEPNSPAKHLAELRIKLEGEQQRLVELEPIKTNIEDLIARIKGLETLLDGQAEADAAYLEFHQTIARYSSEIRCAIPTVRDQLKLGEKERNCVSAAIAAVDARVKEAQDQSKAQQGKLEQLRAAQLELETSLKNSTVRYDCFRSGLQAAIARRHDDLKALDELADPTGNQCEVWFYLYEMEAMLASARSGEQSPSCLDAQLTIGTFLDCWSPDAYNQAYREAIVAFNAAENAHKLGSAVLEQATRRAEVLATTAEEAFAKRRDWILKEIKNNHCCTPEPGDS
jgi:DNA repair exonuclease SbcCD ATPase subunit